MTEPEGPGRRVLALVGSVVAPTTLVTALLFYFGTVYAYWYWAYLGLGISVLELGPSDYFTYAASGLFRPVLYAAAAAALGIVVASRLRTWPEGRARLVWSRRAGIVLGLLAVGAVGMAVVRLEQPLFLANSPWLAGLGLAGGVAATGAAVRLWRAGRVVRPPSANVALALWAARFVLVAVGLFWAVGDYSSAVGTGDAHRNEQAIASVPDVTVYSEKRLSLHLPGVEETACSDANSAYAVRYDGLKFVIRSGSQYVFLPASWRHGSGVAIVLPRTDALRLEFAAPGAPRPRSC